MDDGEIGITVGVRPWNDGQNMRRSSHVKKWWDGKNRWEEYGGAAEWVGKIVGGGKSVRVQRDEKKAVGVGGGEGKTMGGGKSVGVQRDDKRRWEWEGDVEVDR